MAEEQKNSSAETVDAAASAAHTVKGAIKAGKAISGAAKGAAAGGPYGAVAGAVWAGRKHIGKIIDKKPIGGLKRFRSSSRQGGAGK